MDVKLPIRGRPDANSRVEIQCNGKNETEIVVGMLADQVDSARRPNNHTLRPLRASRSKIRPNAVITAPV